MLGSALLTIGVVVYMLLTEWTFWKKDDTNRDDIQSSSSQTARATASSETDNRSSDTPSGRSGTAGS
ncbi:MAG: hypothetical protein AAGC55_10105, partial [Myxococcota bacterium]